METRQQTHHACARMSQVNEVVTFSAFTSTSKDVRQAIRACVAVKGIYEDHPSRITLFSCEAEGYDISGWSLHAEEREVLILVSKCDQQTQQGRA